MRTLILGCCLLLSAAVARAQFKDPLPAGGPRLGSEMTSRVKLGVVVKATGNLFRAVATVPVPAEWPEQQVSIVEEDVSRAVRNLVYRDISGGGGLRLMVVEIPQLPAGQEAHALVTFEVTRTALVPPDDTSDLSIPKKLPRALRINIGPSPFIETRHPRVVAAAKQAAGQADTAWEKAEALYDWTRDNVAYEHGKLKGAARAILDGKGYTDELTSVFVALCRVHKIPARTVFVPGHCYAEFYLQGADGQGHWFPCQPAGVRSFGGIDDVRPILQKGDNFKNPENPKEKLRWVKEFFHGKGRGGSPKVRFVNQPVPI